MNLYYSEMKSIVGVLMIVVSNEALIAILWDNDKPQRVPLKTRLKKEGHPLILEVEKQLAEYFDGKRSLFDIPLEYKGTSFQQDVWKALEKIPYGTTLSYKEIAELIQRPKAIRAVGTAIGKNPFSIIVPCHRVIGSNGSLTGFAGGLDRKKILLQLETKSSQQFSQTVDSILNTGAIQ